MIPITEPGCYALGEAAYHADPCPEPSLSNSIAHVLVERSPRHAWVAHPRLNPDFARTDKTVFDVGSAAHALLLEGEDIVRVVDAADWRTKAAKEARDEAYAAGRVPLLAHQWDAVRAMVDAARAQLDAHEAGRRVFLPGGGEPERTLIWRDGPSWCRARVDWLDIEGQVLWDYKTTGGSAHPDSWTRNHMFPGTGATQAAFYTRGARAALGWERPAFRFVVQENEPPYALSVVALTPAAHDLAERKVRAALALWQRCMETGTWPGYPAGVAWVEAPSWHDWDWSERETRDQSARDAGHDPFKQMIDWQAPMAPRKGE